LLSSLLFCLLVGRSKRFVVLLQISMRCKFTPLYEEFREHVESAHGSVRARVACLPAQTQLTGLIVFAQGDTCLYDALDQGCDELVKWQQKYPKAVLRILCLSDGKVRQRPGLLVPRRLLNCWRFLQDTKSKVEPYHLAPKLQRAKVVVDAVQIGSGRSAIGPLRLLTAGVFLCRTR
jgi:hypothetical protein